MQKFNFYIFGNTHWSFFPHREHHIAIELVKRGHTVHFVEELPSVPRQLRGLFKQNSLITPYYEPGHFEGLEIYKPNMIPTFFKSSILPRIDRKFFRYWFDKKFISRIEPPSILIITVPIWFYLLGERTEFFDRIVYDVCDDLRISARNDRALKKLKRAEMDGIAKAEIVTVSAPAIAEQLRKDYGIVALLIRNGIDENFISRNQFVDKSAKPTVGVIGVFDVIPMLYDLELIKKASVKYPEYTFIMIGRISNANKKVFANCANVEFTGVVTNEELKEHLKNLSICLIPFVSTETVSAINPLKLYEYLAYGKPVVATNNFDADDLDSVAKITNSEEEFLDAIGREINNDNAQKFSERIEKVRKKTWSKRIEPLLNALEK